MIEKRRYWDRETQKWKYQTINMCCGHPEIKGGTALDSPDKKSKDNNTSNNKEVVRYGH